MTAGDQAVPDLLAALQESLTRRIAATRHGSAPAPTEEPVSVADPTTPLPAPEYTNKVCVWADGPDRDLDDYDGIRQDVASALLAPTSAVHVAGLEVGEESVTYTVLIEAPRLDRSQVAEEVAPW